MAHILEVKNLKVQIDNKSILSGIDLKIGVGKTIVIMGPNGSGKSTLANVLAGASEYKVEGQILLANKEIVDFSPDKRAQAGLILAFQYPVEIPGVKVLNFLWTVYTQKHPDREKRQYSSIVDFRDYLYKLAEDLNINQELLGRGLNEGFSGGEKKRLEILQIAVLEPKIVILDEIDSGLDIDAIRLVAKSVNKIQQKTKMALLVITHYQRILEYLNYDEVLIMVDGKIIQKGGPEIVRELEEKGYGKLK